MGYEIFRTTAEHIIGAIDAALQKPEGVDPELVAQFLDTPPDSAQNALLMASQLSLLSQNTSSNIFKVSSPCATYLCTSVRENKAAVLRFVLEQYEPYKLFKFRLVNSTGVVGTASTEIKALCGISAHRDIISETLTDLGTYAKSILPQGAGLYLPLLGEESSFLNILNSVVQNRENAESAIRNRIGNEAASWIDYQSVMANLITAFQKAGNVNDDVRAPIVYAGNAFESFLTQVAGYFGVSLSGASGINAKVDKLKTNNHITLKHYNMSKYLGHVRNAADHGVDAEIGKQWIITPTTAIEYVHVAQSLITDIVAYINGKYQV